MKNDHGYNTLRLVGVELHNKNKWRIFIDADEFHKVIFKRSKIYGDNRSAGP